MTLMWIKLLPYIQSNSECSLVSLADFYASYLIITCSSLADSQSLEHLSHLDGDDSREAAASSYCKGTWSLQRALAEMVEYEQG